MALVDLHLHSIHSEHPSEWFLQRLGARESYTNPLDIYQLAKNSGMNFVTITDHNSISGSLLLKKKYPKDTFVSVETTTYFPEDRCKIHLLIFDINEMQFQKIQELRSNIYLLREYIKENNIAHSVAHATYSINKKLNIEHLEKLILLFDVFESINGGRNLTHNEAWFNTLKNLKPEHIEYLSNKHSIEPYSSNSWLKGFTGGSDDHAGIFVGKSYTYAQTDNLTEFLRLLKEKKTFAGGRHNDYQSLAFSVYKIAYEFSKSKNRTLSNSFFNQLSEMIFSGHPGNFIDNYNLKRLKKKSLSNGDKARYLLYDLIQTLRNNKKTPIYENLDLIFERIEEISDEFFKDVFKQVEKNINQGDLFSFLKTFTSSLPGIFLSLPFFTTLKHMGQGRDLLEELHSRFAVSHPKKKRVLWFTDTINDLNGVSVTLKHLGWYSHKNNYNITIVTSLPESEITEHLPPNILNLTSVYEFRLPVYKSYKLRFPSILNSISKIYKLKPDEIFVSTPGPLGLMGLLVSNLLSIKSTGIYHTDFSAQCHSIEQSESLAGLIESYTRWFYSSLNSIKVPTSNYIELLSQRGFDHKVMSVFKRGIDIELFAPNSRDREEVMTKYSIEKGFNLLYTGRISKDKNLDFLIRVFNALRSQHQNINLLIIGDGPYLQELEKKHLLNERIIFTGPIDRDLLPEILSMADLFVFPSNTDTFGMSVLEAQACGIPALVSNMGGPQEIIIDQISGFVLPADDLKEWSTKISFFIELAQANIPLYLQFKEKSRSNVVANYSWDLFLGELAERPFYERGKGHEEDFTVETIPHW
jgi:glycosyltransferase involved in cell wall biosynthesis